MVRIPRSISLRVFILRAVVRSELQSYNHVRCYSSQPEPQLSKIFT